ncbi:leucine-rich repeat domain-containing protein [Apibacter sp. HY039]|uniref:leucine-rich repeat domain-containing protein n=1 Tax=Apibacter sp. HY039 TaxID=2501476 RepID=UPI000FEBF863|nr:leucine-rich repeat domain-containing protein [Apibacter sp. HY039]
MKQSYYLSLLCFFLCFSLSWGQLSKNYEVATPGTLSQLVGTDKAKITDLSLTGTLNSADFLTIRQMTALKNLDMLNAYLVNGLLPNYSLANKTFNKVRLSKNLKTLGHGVFSNSTLNELDFSNCTELESIGKYLAGNAKIAVIDLSKNLKLTNFYTDDFNQGTFSEYSGKVILPENLKTVKAYTFVNFKGEVDLPSTVEVIEREAFSKSTPKSLKLSKNLKSIGHGAFANSILNELDFSNCTELESMGKGMVSNVKLGVIDLSKNLKLTNFYTDDWHEGTFSEYSGKVILPANLKTVKAYTFVNFKGEVDLPSTVEVIEREAFSKSTPKSLKLSKNLKTLGHGVFSNSTLNELDFSNCTELQSIGKNLAGNAKIAVIDLSKNLKLTNFYTDDFNQGTFSGYSGKVILPENLKTVKAYTFVNFKGEVNFPSTVEVIEKEAFRNSSVKELFLPSTMKNIGNGAFSGCKELEKLSICAITPPQLGIEVFKGINFSKVELSVPKNTLAKYNQASQWKDFTVTVETDRCVAGPEIIKDPQVYAPNSYIYDVDAAKANNYGGLEIPVAKAYAMWETNEFMERKGIPEGTLSASVYWEDVEGLVRSVSVNQNGKDSKIKVMINKIKGKGNAVVALHVGATGDPLQDPVYWSWHVWATDDPTQGKTYDNNPDSKDHLVNTFMDRNLGAISNSFLGNEWNRSGGLMYQWGRKDPFPPMAYKDKTSAHINTLNKGKLNRSNYEYKIQQFRISSKVALNIQQSVQSPFDIIVPPKEELILNSEGKLVYLSKSSWITDDLERDYAKNGRVYDLWADNTNGKRMPGQVFEQQPKSPFDPCPSGWRIPSYAHMWTDNHASSPWGKVGTDGFPQSDFSDPKLNTRSQKVRTIFKGIKIYPSLGFDFSGVSGYDLGQYPLTGHYMSYADKMVYQDEGSESFLWGATLNDASTANVFHMIADQYNTYEGREGAYIIDTRELTAGHTISLNGVRCVKENSPVSDLTTQYVSENIKNYDEGLYNPNSYQLVKNSKEQKVFIPVNKAFSIYNQYLTDHQWPQGRLSANVYWTIGPNDEKDFNKINKLIKGVLLHGTDENGTIEVQITPNTSGNAVVSLHSGSQGNSSDPILWSWHIWVANNEVKSHIYTTEKQYSDTKNDYSSFLAFNTTSGLVPLSTEFMDRDLGALEYDISSNNKSVYSLTGGLQYQWGRKDPLPTYYNVGTNGDSYHGSDYFIYKGSTLRGNLEYKVVPPTNYYNNYNYLDLFTLDVLKSNIDRSVKSILKTSIENPLTSIVFGNDNLAYNWLPVVLPELWGHSTVKSPFDPCPEGWRVPDLGFLDSKNTPWYKESSYKKNDNNEWVPVLKKAEDYKGRILEAKQDTDNGFRGVIFDDPFYNIGYIAFQGARMSILPKHSDEPERWKFRVYDINLSGGLWSAAMIDRAIDKGEALATKFAFYNRKNANNLDFPSEITRTALQVRCAKDQPRFTKESIMNPPLNSSVRRNYVEVQSVEEKASTLTESQIRITPNPTSGLFKVLLTGVPEGKLSVVNINGTVIHSQTFANSTEVDVNIQNQPSGVYGVQIQAQGQVVNKKVIKK